MWDSGAPDSMSLSWLKKNEIHVSSTDKSPASAILGLEIGFDFDFGA
jgi:hypothetical protein